MRKLVLITLFSVVIFAAIVDLGLSDHANAANKKSEKLPIFDTHVHYKEAA